MPRENADMGDGAVGKAWGVVLVLCIGIAGACGDDDGGAPSTETTVAADPLVADFVYDVALESVGDFGCAPGVATFTDRSTGEPTGWSWEFPDGSTSTEQNPSIDFIDQGAEVTLTISRGDDTASVTKEVSYPIC